MQRFYLVPIELRNNTRGPKYFGNWGRSESDPNPEGIYCEWGLMDYGFDPRGLVFAKNITQIDHDALILNSDVFAFPELLDGPVNDPSVDTFFEDINIPTDWLTPSTTWLELLRQLAGMFLFNQRYSGIAAAQTNETHSIFDNATLETMLRQMAAQEQSWFLATVDSFGFDSSQINDNSRLRQLVKQAGNFWEGQPFIMAGVEF